MVVIVVVVVVVVVVCNVFCVFFSPQCNRHCYSCQALYELVEYNYDDYDGIIRIVNNNIPPLLTFSLRTGQNGALCKPGLL